jgi:putative transposase
MSLVREAIAHGATARAACRTLGMSVRTYERWQSGKLEDNRKGPKSAPSNKLTAEERARIVKVLTSARFRDLSPNEIVPALADESTYLASEATLYRILREERLLAHRGRAKPPARRPPRAHTATGPNQVWSWDITYLKSPIRGSYYFLYLMMDVWSRMVVGWAIHEAESAEHAAELFQATCREQRVNPNGIVLHADNGGPMKGSTMVATLERLGVLPSFSRPHVSNDNPFSEALFRTLKYRPNYPDKPFKSIEDARTWTQGFVAWYNNQHRHSGIRFVTPHSRHFGKEKEILARRHQAYTKARSANPNRWTANTRNWNPIQEVYLNPENPEVVPHRCN